MASSEIVKTVHIETGGGERSVKSLRKEISDLRDALLNMDQGGEDWVATAQQLTQAQNDLNAVMRAGKGDMDATSDSIAGMEAQYKSLYSTYRLLGSEARNTAEGLAMRDQLAELSTNLNNAKKDAGNFKDNIGRYASDIMGAFNKMGVSMGAVQAPMKAVTMASQGLGAALKSLAANPVGAVIMAVVVVLKALEAIFKRVKKAIQSNEDYQKRMNKAMAAFKPIGDLVAKIFDKIAGVVVKVVEGIASAVSWISNLTKKTKELNEAETAIAEKENELIDLRREAQVLNSEDEAEVQTLWEQASATENVAEKQQLLAEAKEKQEAINKRNVELAQAELDLLVMQASVRPNSIEDNNKIAQAQANLNNAIANGERQMRRLNNAINATNRSARSAGSSGKNTLQEEKEMLDEVLKRLEENSKTEIQVLTEKYEKEKALLEKYHKDTTKLTEEYQKNIQAIYDKLEIQNYISAREVREAYVDTIVQPSTEAYNLMIRNAAKSFNDYKDYLAQIHILFRKEAGELDIPSNYKLFEGIWDDYNKWFLSGPAKIFKEDTTEFTAEFAKINEMFDIGAKEGDELATILEKIRVKFLELGVPYEEAIKNRDAWVRSTTEIRKQLEMEADKMEVINFPPDSTFEKLKMLNDIEMDYYRDRVMRARKFYDTLNSIYEKGDESALNAAGYTIDDLLGAWGDYYATLEEYQNKELENNERAAERENELLQQRRDNYFNLGKTVVSSYNTISDSITKLIQDQIKEGKLSQKEIDKKKKNLEALEAVQLSVTLAGIAADATSSIMGVWNSYSKELVLNAETAAATGPAAAATKAALDAKSLTNAILRTGALGAQAAAAATAAVTKSIGNWNTIKGLGETSASDSTPAAIDSNPYSYTRQVQTDSEREQELNRPIYVRVTDINNVQNRVKVMEQETTF